MALAIDKGHTALLAMDFENDIVHENGAFKDFGFAAMVKQNDVLAKSARLLDAARRSGVKVIHAVIKYRPGYQNALLTAVSLGVRSRPTLSWRVHGVRRYTNLSPPRMESRW